MTRNTVQNERSGFAYHTANHANTPQHSTEYALQRQQPILTHSHEYATSNDILTPDNGAITAAYMVHVGDNGPRQPAASNMRE